MSCFSSSFNIGFNTGCSISSAAHWGGGGLPVLLNTDDATLSVHGRNGRIIKLPEGSRSIGIQCVGVGRVLSSFKVRQGSIGL